MSSLDTPLNLVQSLEDVTDTVSSHVIPGAEILPEAGPPARQARMSWIFQAIPEDYNLPAALAKLPQLSWLVSRYAREIQPGDRVYLWASGKKAGIYAVARVVTPTQVMPDLPAEAEFQLVDETADEKDRPRVMVTIEHVLEVPVPRSDIKVHPDLGTLQIIKFAQGTNFRVSPREDEVLWQMVRERLPAAALGEVSSPPS